MRNVKRTSELLAVDGLPARPVPLGKISTLEHELHTTISTIHHLNHQLVTHLRDHAMERTPLIPKAILPGAQLTEVPRGLGYDVVVELEDDRTRGFFVDADVEEDVFVPKPIATRRLV